ncbi:MAG: TetR/AcrR family transcriptional regulator [Brochothrix thermosphacta]|uniref:TetR/AcrR family transcriptional regulator n=1 Tax=Brochothrix thermosphacta TaxID=2756 RepID=UPI000E757595|nr:TetR/AcrR family transcriptional regulator [Brochothrix thermosphacta]ANZ95010.1 hypothetical protein BFC19_06290 [Brochothrix thermosphacta]
MEKTTDLRIIKTQRAIKTTFLQLINKKELSKITVAELARIAEINKGTFYLHYADIYELYSNMLAESISKTANKSTYYSKMLTDPETFVSGFFTPSPESTTAEETALFRPENLRFGESFLAMMITAIINNIYATEVIPKTTHNTMKLRFLIGGMFSEVIQISTEKPHNIPFIDKETINYLISQIKHSFPEIYNVK